MKPGPVVFLLFLLLDMSLPTPIPQGKIIPAATSSELAHALSSASPGDTIQLLPIDYTGDFICHGNNTSSLPGITILGGSTPDRSRGTVILANVTAFKISGGSWTISSMTIRSEGEGIIGSGAKVNLISVTLKVAQSGVVLQGDDNCIRSVTIEAGQMALSLTGNRNVVRSVTVIGVKEGVILQGDDNCIRSMTINGATEQGVYLKGSNNSVTSVTLKDIAKEGITVDTGSESTEVKNVTVWTSSREAKSLHFKEGSFRATVNSVTLEGIVEIRGDGNNFSSSAMQSDLVLLGSGNTFKSSIIQSLFMKDASGSNVFEPCTIIVAKVDNPLH